MQPVTITLDHDHQRVLIRVLMEWREDNTPKMRWQLANTNGNHGHHLAHDLGVADDLVELIIHAQAPRV